MRRHALTECERLLSLAAAFRPRNGRSTLWMCECGRAWVRVCDEAEGCFWGRVPGNDAEEKD